MMMPNFEEIAKNMIIRQYGSEKNAINAMKQQAGNHPVLKNAVSLLEKHDYQGLQKLGENVFNENHMNPQNMAQNLIERFMGGIK